jgi:thioredoxin-dependent peroxiredoxin
MKLLAKVGATLLMLYFSASLSGGLRADENKVNLKVGDPAPEFTSTDDQGQPWKSSDHIGKKVLVIYFYPADLTRGCTAQACGFRDDTAKLADKGIEVVGVSGDSAENHQVFKKVKNLPFTLLADEKGDVAKKFGVPFGKGGTFPTKDADGNPITLKRGVTIQRWTFVIGKDGKIIDKETKVNAANDSKHILDVIEKQEK